MRFGATLAGTWLLASQGHAGTIPSNLGHGLRELVQQSQTATAATAAPRSLVLRPGWDPLQKHPMIWDGNGRVLVSVHFNGLNPAAQMIAALRADPEVKVTAEAPDYSDGVAEAYVTPATALRLAKTPGVGAVLAVQRPVRNVGVVTSQGFYEHNVDKIAGRYNGAGIRVGVISDSYDTAKLNTDNPPLTTAAADVASGDLPGPGNPFGNTTPVAVLQDFPNGTDEGRGMLQIVHDLAPKAALAFATADYGEVGFANNIRRLRNEFHADVIVDDIFYFDEPFFQDGIVAQAVDDVAANGAAYFSSAGNQSPTEAYAAPLRRVPFNPANPGAALKNTNLKLAEVDPALYAGGFHNFNPDGQDIAQTVHVGQGDSVALQWNDGYQTKTPKVLRSLFSGTGALTSPTSAPTFTFNNPTANDQVRIDVYGTGATPNLDVKVAVIAPDGTVLVNQDTGTGETAFAFLPTAGAYTIQVTGFEGATGAFTVKVGLTDGKELVTTDLNLLIFDDAGNFLGAFADNNLVTNQPQESGTLPIPTGRYQFVIAYGNVPTGRRIADQVRWEFLNPGDSYVVEYLSTTAPSIGGHTCAKGANSVGAYSPFRPYIPEDFTARGPVTIYFDKDGNRLSQPEVRRKPDVSATDGGNTTFFVADTTRDVDTFPNFFGTSAAAPHAAAIGALVLEAHGGPGSLKPAQLASILKASGLPHDLDPYQSTALAFARGGIVLVTARGTDEVSSQIDPNQFTVRYVGLSSLTSLSFDLKGANPTGGNVYQAYPGEVFDTRPLVEEFDTVTLNGGFPFTLGASQGLTAGDVKAAYAEPAPAPSVAGQYYRLNLSFRPGAFSLGSTLRFGIDRDEQHSAFSPLPTGTGGGDSRRGGSADLLGEGVLIPSGAVVGRGARVEGTFADGSRFSTEFHNLIGRGYSPLDGYGFIDAAAAVRIPLAPLP